MGLVSAVGRGDVIEMEEGSSTLYYFPKKKFGSKTNFSTSVSVSRDKATTSEAFGAISQMMGSLGWNLKSSKKSHQAFCHCLAG